MCCKPFFFKNADVNYPALLRITFTNLNSTPYFMTKHIHALMKFMISAVLSLIAWVVVDRFIVHITFIQYFFVEVVIIISQFVYDWHLKRLNHEKEIVQ